jgi:hypothetical protein
LHPIPGWHTTGPFAFKEWSHNIHWGGVAKDLGEIGAGAATFFTAAGMAKGMLPALGAEAETAVASGIAERSAAKAAAKALHNHHPEPKYMGGAEKQELEQITDALHRTFHSMLAKAQREAGFPPVGGKSGSAIAWGRYFRLNPTRRKEAMDILRSVSQKFDEIHGTSISSKLPPP